jgi:hypothetical protein
LDCIPNDDGKSVTIVITAPHEKIGVQGLIKVLAQFIKHLIETNNIRYDEVKIKPSDTVKIRDDE